MEFEFTTRHNQATNNQQLQDTIQKCIPVLKQRRDLAKVTDSNGNDFINGLLVPTKASNLNQQSR
jgi:hypothetical protein